MPIYVVDTSAILSNFIGEQMIAPIRVYDELRKYRNELPEYLYTFYEEKLKFFEPSRKSINKVIEAAKETGDYYRLSETDVHVIALALDFNGIVVTNDLSVQNVCKILNIKYMSYLNKEITRIFEWEIVCKSCGRILDKKYDSCPYCGGDVGYRIKKIKKL
ncbi:MAG: hypothetical protein J7K58_05065 [Euryarchaeota archaeon]|nr:hypothetical protein [Euryarchaeota archaeon]